MVREVLTISIGQAGVQLGDAVWQQYCAEHGVTATGNNPDTKDDGSFRCFFEETNGGLFVPRNLSVDLEPNVIDDIRNGYEFIFYSILFYFLFKNVFCLYMFKNTHIVLNK